MANKSNKKIHRWQFTNRTPCGLEIDGNIETNIGHYLSNGVTCLRCLGATTFLSILGDKWNGQSDGYPQATRMKGQGE